MDKIEKIKEWLKPYLEEDKIRDEHEEGFFHCAMLFDEFLDTLPEESDKTFDDYLKASPSERRKMNMTEILGEEKLAETKEQLSLEKEIQRYLREECSGDDEPPVSEIARHFAEWQKEQMMMEAVEGEVYGYVSPLRKCTSILIEGYPEKYGVKVRIIVLKEATE